MDLPLELRNLLNNLYDDPDEAVTVLDTEYAIIWVNNAMEKKGFLLSNVKGHKSYKIFDHLDIADPTSPATQCMRENKVVNLIRRGYDGIDYDIIAVPIHTDEGKIRHIVELTRLASLKRGFDFNKLLSFRELPSIEEQFHFERNDIVLGLLDKKEIMDKTINFIEQMLNDGYEGVVVTFNPHTYDMVVALQNRKIDTDKIRFVDGISIVAGKGCPPVKYLIVVYPPKNYQDIYYYTFVSLIGMQDKKFVLYLDIEHMLTYLSFDDLGVSLLTSFQRLQDKALQIMFLSTISENKMLEAVVRRLVTKVVRL